MTDMSIVVPVIPSSPKSHNSSSSSSSFVFLFIAIIIVILTHPPPDPRLMFFLGCPPIDMGGCTRIIRLCLYINCVRGMNIESFLNIYEIGVTRPSRFS